MQQVLEWPVETIHAAVKYLDRVLVTHGTDRIAEVHPIVERHASTALRIWSTSEDNDALGLDTIWVARGICQFQLTLAELWDQAIEHGVEEEFHALVERIRDKYRDIGDWISASIELAVQAAKLWA